MKLNRLIAASIVGISLLSASTSAFACDHEEKQQSTWTCIWDFFCHRGDGDKGSDKGNGGHDCSGGGGNSSGSGSSGSSGSTGPKG